MRKRRRAITLLLVLTSLALLAALVTPLAALSGLRAVESAHAAAGLRHRLAADSAITLVPQLLRRDGRLQAELDGRNRAAVSFTVGTITVDVLVQDDTAKLPIELIRSRRGLAPTRAALTTLAAQQPLPALELHPDLDCAVGPARWGWCGCLEDLFAAPQDAALYGRPESRAVWTHYLTPLGRTVHAFRAAPAVLEAALGDLQPGLGLELARQRERQVRPELPALLATCEVPVPQQRTALERLTTTTERYSLLIRTRLGDDVRQRYVLCTAGAAPRVLLDWEVDPCDP